MCDSYYTLTQDPPQVFLFDGPNCTKRNKNIVALPFSASGVPNFDQYPQTNPFGSNVARSIVIQPGLAAKVFSKPNYSTAQRYGLLNAGQYPALSENTTYVKDRDLESLWLYLDDDHIDASAKKCDTVLDCQNKAWDSFRFRCCTGVNPFNICSSYNPNLSGNICPSFMTNYCSQDINMGTPQCQQFCTVQEGNGVCDVAVANYCKNHGYDDPFCACYNSKIVGAPPQCLDANCITKGYKNKSMLGPCDITQINCQQVINTDGNNNIVDQTKLQLYCGTNSNNNNNPTNQSLTQKIMSFAQSHIHWVIFIFVMIVAVIVFIIYEVTTSRT